VLPEVPVAIDAPDHLITSIRQATGQRYKIVRRIGSGGMADVYEARHHLLDRPRQQGAVRDLTVRDADTLLRIPASELPRVQTDLQRGINEGGITLAIQPAEDEADLRAPQPEDLGAAIAVAVTEVVADTVDAPEAPPVQADDAGTT